MRHEIEKFEDSRLQCPCKSVITGNDITSSKIYIYNKLMYINIRIYFKTVQNFLKIPNFHRFLDFSSKFDI